jgi:hypothetical protein
MNEETVDQNNDDNDGDGEVEVTFGMVVSIVKDADKCKYLHSTGQLMPASDQEGKTFLVISAQAMDGEFDFDCILQNRRNSDIVYANVEQLGNFNKVCPKCRELIPICKQCGHTHKHTCRD